MNARAVIAGHGQMGRAFEALLRRRVTLTIWDVAPGRIEPAPAVAEALRGTGFLFLCVPTAALDPVLGAVAGLLTADTAVLSIAKGLDEAGRTAADMLQVQRADGRWGVLGGPMIAHEIAAGKAAFAELGSRDAALVRDVLELFHPTALRLTGSLNPRAVSWCGVLKNVYAPLVGVADELGWGANARGHIVAAAAGEMQHLLRMLAGMDADGYGDAGLADLVATVSSADSHHYEIGRRVARGETGLPECEGLHSLRVLTARDAVEPGNHPLYAVATRLVNDPHSVPRRLQDWLAR
ncbi:MAG TPA: hypothetical protein VHP13_05655 [Gammaproteobacteria bacterium]|jgi:glycerol-3-phosphate dehydrogenase (NAD(P)+)|nr:hypothetical protein [Gammaproteobacteria bacterium]